ncbi:UNVERIFIED_CONTAM: hypothetical protein BEN50_19385 [Euhalothece sp. KZN 001]
MERRRFLRSAGICGAVGLAGCAGSPADPVWSVREDPQPPGVRYTVEVVRGPTSTAPLTLQITIANPDETRGVRYGERRRALFWVAEVDDPFGTYPAAGVEDRLRYDVDQETWQLPDPFVMTMDYQWGVLDPGEAHTEQVVLVNDPTADPPVAVDTRETIAARTAIVIEQERAEDPTEVTWGFEVISP